MGNWASLCTTRTNFLADLPFFYYAPPDCKVQFNIGPFQALPSYTTGAIDHDAGPDQVLRRREGKGRRR